MDSLLPSVTSRDNAEAWFVCEATLDEVYYDRAIEMGLGPSNDGKRGKCAFTPRVLK